MKCRHIPTDTDIINKKFSANYLIDRDFRVCRKCGKKIELSHPALVYIALALFLPIEVCLSVLFEVGWSDIKLYYRLTEWARKYVEVNPGAAPTADSLTIAGTISFTALALFLFIANIVVLLKHYGRLFSWKSIAS